MPIQVQIVGCGAVMQELYRPPLTTLEQQKQLKVVALVDPNRERTRELQRHFPAARGFASPQEDFVRDQVQLTLVASPPGYHAEHTVCALNWGSHVLCEKPMAPTVAECRQMIDAAAATGTALGIGMPRRFYPTLRHLRGLIERGELGADLRFVYREGGQYGWPIKSTEGFSRAHGGGVLLDIGPHVLDTIQWLFGPLAAEQYRDDALNQGIEANCLLRLHSQRATGLVQLSWDQDLANEFRVTGSRGDVVIDPSTLNRIAFRSNGGWRTPRLDIAFPATVEAKESRRGRPKTYSDCMYYQLVQMLRCIRLGEPPAVSAEEGARVMALINSCYDQAEPLSMDWLTTEEMSAYRALHWRQAQ